MLHVTFHETKDFCVGNIKWKSKVKYLNSGEYLVHNGTALQYHDRNKTLPGLAKKKRVVLSVLITIAMLTIVNSKLYITTENPDITA